MNWVVQKVADAKTPAWVVLLLLVLLLLGAGISGTMLVLRRRKVSKLVHERNVLLEEKKAAKANAELAANDRKREQLEKERVIIDKKLVTADKKIEDLSGKHARVKASIEGVMNWDDLKVD